MVSYGDIAVAKTRRKEEQRKRKKEGLEREATIAKSFILVWRG